MGRLTEEKRRREDIRFLERVAKFTTFEEVLAEWDKLPKKKAPRWKQVVLLRARARILGLPMPR